MTANDSRWSLRRRLAVVLGGTALAGAVVVLGSLVAMIRVDDAVHRATTRLDPANAAVLDLYGGLLDQETGVRGYVLTHQESFLQPYQQGRSEQAAAQASAVLLLGNEKRLAGDLASVLAAAQTWQRDFAEPAVTTTRVGGTVTQSDVDRGKADFDAVRARFATLRTDLSSARASAQRQLGSALDTRWVWFGIALGVLLVAGALLVVGLRRWVTRPLEHLAADARVIAAGDIEHPIRVEGPQELVAVATDVETMRRELAVHIDVARTAQQAAEDAREQLAEQATALQRSNAELEQFAYVASHDLQEPLRKVASFCQLLEQRYADQLDDRAHSYIGFAVDGAKRMQVLINDLLAFSRAGRTSAGFEPVQLDALCAEVTNELSARIEDAHAQVSVDPLPEVLGDASLLRQLLTNLLGNALKFRSDADPVVRLTASRSADTWLLSCTDNGIGIEPQYAEKIFVIFQRLHGRDTYAGTGIGLALCKKIVEYHGGRIWIDTDYTGGARICFTLPAERTTAQS